MKPMIYYGILKSYKGVFKKKHVGNTHQFFVPINQSEVAALVIIGKITTEKVYVAALLDYVKIENVQAVLDTYEKEGKNWITLESLPCKVKSSADNIYHISLLKKGNYIKSDFIIEFKPEFSTDNRVLFTLKGNFDFEVGDISNQTVGMTSNKMMAKLGAMKKVKS